MSILYNKTALKKMKKDDLIDMFLNRQANVLDDDMKKEASTELEKEYSRRISELIEIVNEKNQQIHNIISEHKQESTEQYQLIEGFNTSLMKLQDENQNLREEIQKYKDSSLRTIEATPREITAEMEEYEDTIETMEHDNDELAEQFQILNDFCGGIPDNDGQAIVDYICSLYKYEDQCIELEAEIKSS